MIWIWEALLGVARQVPDYSQCSGHELRQKGFRRFKAWGDVMEGENFAGFIARERERLHGERERIFNQQQELGTQLAAVNNEMRAIDAYESAKTGKPMATPQVRGRGGARQVRRGSRRDSILRVIRENPAGLSRGELLERMGLKGDKSGEMSVSNAPTTLTKAGQVHRQDGKYRGAA